MKMPVLFIGHGSPMNAVQKNPFSESLAQLGQELPTPKAILVVSAHWRTHGSKILNEMQPKTIHDFSGFPKELSEIQYQSPGSPEVAHRVLELLQGEDASLTSDWGLDHGAWAVLIHMYPKANIPVLQLGLNRRMTFQQHFDLAKKLKPLRQDGILILGSGNIVHNLGEMNWEDENGEPFSWATSFDHSVRDILLSKNFEDLAKLSNIDPIAIKKSMPTTEHYLPLLYAAACADVNDSVQFPYDAMAHGSLSMRSVKFG